MSLWETKLAKKGLTFDDVLLIPAESHVLPNEVKLDTKLAPNLQLHIPIHSLDNLNSHCEFFFEFGFSEEDQLKELFAKELIPLPKETWQLPWPKMVA